MFFRNCSQLAHSLGLVRRRCGERLLHYGAVDSKGLSPLSTA